MCIIGSWYSWSPIGHTEAVSASGNQYLSVSGTIACTGWLIPSWLPIWYSCIISGSFMPVVYPWYPRIIGWVSTQPCFFYPLDILQGSPSWGCLPFSLINHLLCLILRVQLLYSLVRNWLVQFHCLAIVIRCFFLFHRPVLCSVLNLTLSMVRTFWFCSNESLDTLVCIHHLLWNNTVSLIIRLSGGVVLWELLCFPAYAFPMLTLFHV